MQTLKLLSISLMVAAASASGGTILIPSTTVLGTDTFGGPTITLPVAVLPTDTLTLTASGQVFLQGPGLFGTNAAGVVTTAGTSPVGGSAPNGSTNFGALLLGNATLGFFQVFSTNAANGLGSVTPPSSLTINNVPLSSSGFTSTLPAGTILQFRPSDINTSDNSGSFIVSGQINTAAVTGGVPEPGTVTLFLIGAMALGGFRLRRNADTCR